MSCFLFDGLNFLHIDETCGIFLGSMSIAKEVAKIQSF